MKVSSALFRLASECLSALLIALMLVSAVAQARALAGHATPSGGAVQFAVCQSQADSDTAPETGNSHGCMQCCLSLVSILPLQGGAGLAFEWHANSVRFAPYSFRVNPLFLVQEARGPPVM